MLLLALSHSADEAVALPDQARVGRLTGVELRIDEPTVSRDHARFSWNGDHWTVRDLASTSGTVVDGRRIASGADVRIDVDGLIRFGGGAEMRILSAEAPEPQDARPGTLATIRKSGKRFALYRGSSGPIDRATRTQETAEGRLVATSTLVLQPSRDWDDMFTQIRTAREDVIDLGTRSHYLLLYVLARHAVDEHGSGLLSRPHDGWLHRELVERRVGADRKWVNTSVFRLREELHRRDFADCDRVVWRDETSQRMRIGVSRVELLPERL